MKGFAKPSCGIMFILVVCSGCIPMPFVRHHTYSVDKGCLFLVNAETKASIDKALLLRVSEVSAGSVEGPGERERERRVDKAFVFRSGERFVSGEESGVGIGLLTIVGAVGGITREYETDDYLAFASGYRGTFLSAWQLDCKGEKDERVFVPIAHDEALAQLDWLKNLPDKSEITSEEIRRMDVSKAASERDAANIRQADWPIQVRLKARDRRVIEDFVREAKAELQKGE